MQYAEQLHRERADKTRVRIIDFIDARYMTPLRMRDGHQQLSGHRLPHSATSVSDDLDFDVASIDETRTGIPQTGVT